MSLDDIKKLREVTDMPVADCRNALQEAKGDFQKALELLQKASGAKAQKKEDRVTKSGRIESYIHFGGRVGVLLEIRSETDFVANTDQFKTLAHEIAMHIAAMKPLYISSNNIPAEVLEEEKNRIQKESAASGKPANIMEEIIKGKLDKYFSEVCLLQQLYVKDENMRVKDLIDAAVGKLGEKIEIARFTRYEI